MCGPRERRGSTSARRSVGRASRGASMNLHEGACVYLPACHGTQGPQTGRRGQAPARNGTWVSTVPCTRTCGNHRLSAVAPAAMTSRRFRHVHSDWSACIGELNTPRPAHPRIASSSSLHTPHVPNSANVARTAPQWPQARFFCACPQRCQHNVPCAEHAGKRPAHPVQCAPPGLASSAHARFRPTRRRVARARPVTHARARAQGHLGVGKPVTLWRPRRRP